MRRFNCKHKPKHTTKVKFNIKEDVIPKLPLLKHTKQTSEKVGWGILITNRDTGIPISYKKANFILLKFGKIKEYRYEI